MPLDPNHSFTDEHLREWREWRLARAGGDVTEIALIEAMYLKALSEPPARPNAPGATELPASTPLLGPAPTPNPKTHALVADYVERAVFGRIRPQT